MIDDVTSFYIYSSNFHRLEAGDRGSDPQLQMTENLNIPELNAYFSRGGIPTIWIGGPRASCIYKVADAPRGKSPPGLFVYLNTPDPCTHVCLLQNLQYTPPPPPP